MLLEGVCKYRLQLCSLRKGDVVKQVNHTFSYQINLNQLQKLFSYHRCFKALLILGGKYKKILAILAILQRKKTRK